MLKSSTRKERIFLLCLFIIAFAARLAFTAFMKQNYFFYDHPSADVVYYQDWAHDIAVNTFIGNKVFSGLPLYPYFLSVIYRLSLGHIEIMRIFHLLIGSLSCLLLYAVAKKIFSRRIGVLASLFIALNFFMIYYDWLMMPVTLLTFLSLLIILALAERERFSSYREWGILGFLTGCAVLGDGKFLFFLVITAGWLWLTEPVRRKSVIVMVLSALSVVGLCAVRNKIISKDWVLISAQSGLSFYSGNNPQAAGTYVNPAFIRPTHKGQDDDQRIVVEAVMNRTMTSAEVSNFWKSKAFHFIRNHPADYAKLLLRKASLFFRETEDAHDMDLLFIRDWKYQLNWNTLAFLFPLAFIGMIVSFRRWRFHPFVFFLILCQFLMTLIFFLATRHRATVLPLLILFQAAAIFWFVKQIQRKQFLKLSAAVLFIVLFALTFSPVYMDAATIDYNRFAKTGAVYAKQGDFQNAKKQYLAALEFVPYDSNTLYNLGNVYVEEKDFVRAEEMYRASLKVCAYNVDSLFNLAYVYEEQGMTESALDLYKKVAGYQPDSPDVFFRTANLYAKTGQCRQAVELYRKVIKLDPALKDHINPLITECSF